MRMFFLVPLILTFCYGGTKWPKYLILQAIARDVLAIPVTYVAFESAFSSGGRLIDHHRSKLHITTVEAFMCTRSWLMDNRGS
ncbi:Putative AC transposase [Linum perenne]